MGKFRFWNAELRNLNVNAYRFAGIGECVAHLLFIKYERIRMTTNENQIKCFQNTVNPISRLKSVGKWRVIVMSIGLELGSRVQCNCHTQMVKVLRRHSNG